MDFGLTAAGVADAEVFGQYVSASDMGVGSLDIKSGALSKLSPLDPSSGGLAWIEVELPWIVWDQYVSNTQPGWTVVALNASTHERIVLASDDPGSPNAVPAGQAPYPVIRKGVVAWAEPSSPDSDGKPRGRVVTFNLATRSSQAVAAGVVSSPVYAGDYLVWAEQAPDGSFAFEAVNADTLMPADVTDQLPSLTSVLYLAGSADYLAWTSQDLNQLSVVTLRSGAVSVFTAKPDFLHRIQFPALVGDYVAWYTGDRFSVMDLTTGGAFDVMGSAAAGNGTIALAQPNGPVPKGQLSRSRVSSLAISQVPHLAATGCA